MSTSPVRESETPVHAPLSIGKVTLVVHDLAAVTRFYAEAVGLHVLSSDAGSARLGAGGRVLLELRADPVARRRGPREAGLFHTAFLLPARADLAHWTRHALESRIAVQGASDHLVSEAIYLADPEGNGIEIYADRPRSAWTYEGGMVKMATEPLDFEDLMRATPEQPWQGFPDGAVVGHVHLQVGAIPPAEAFYMGVLGFDLTCRYPGGSFFSTGGYHHHLAANVWNSRGAEPRSLPSTGLAEVELRAQDRARLEQIRRRLADAGGGGEVIVRDPWNTVLALRAAEE